MSDPKNILERLEESIEDLTTRIEEIESVLEIEREEDNDWEDKDDTEEDSDDDTEESKED